VKSAAAVIVLVSIGLSGCSIATQPEAHNKVQAADSPFASGGSIDMQLGGGNYSIRAAADDRIRVTFEGNTDGATAELTNTGKHAALIVKGTPHNNFQATIEVPKAADLLIRLAAGNLEVDAISGNKDIDSNAGNASIAVGDPNDYAAVDASVKVGNLDAEVFGHSGSGLGSHLSWSGKGAHKLNVNLTAGNLELKR
jgi:hypothetical protein